MKKKKINLAQIREVQTDFFANHKQLIKILFSVFWLGVIGYILYLGWESRIQLLYYIKNAEWSQFILVVFIYIATIVLASSIWTVIIQAFDDSLNWWTHIQVYFVTLMSRRLPGTVWYIGGRIFLYNRFGVSGIKVTSASGVELVISFVANCILAMLLLPFGLGISKYWFIPFLLASLLGLFILKPSNLEKIMIKLKRPLSRQINKWQIALWLFLRLALVLTGGLMIFFTIRIFTPIGIESLLLVLGARALSGAAGMLTYLLPSSMGASDLTLLAMLSTIIPTPLATVIALLVRIYTTLFELIIGFIFFILLNKSFPFSKLKSAEEEVPEEKLNDENSEKELQEYRSR